MTRNRETNIQNSALLAVGLRQDVLAMRLQSGVFRRMDAPKQFVRVGEPGIADTMLIVAVQISPDMVGRTIGVAVAAEIKTDTGRQSTPQKNWQAAVEKRGGIYRLVRSAEDMLNLVEDVQHGRW